MEYAFTGTIPEMTRTAESCFLLTKPVIDKSFARKRAGAEGGKANKAKPEQTNSKNDTTNKKNTSNENTNSQQNASKTKTNCEQTATDKSSSDKEGDIDDEKDFDNDLSPPVSPSKNEDDCIKNFIKFWEAYPVKVKKQRALIIWKNLNPNNALLDKILSVIEVSKNSAEWKRENGRFIPHPTKWLREKRWEDDLSYIETTGRNKFGNPSKEDYERMVNLQKKMSQD